MIADYLVNRIDNLFSEKHHKSNPSQLSIKPRAPHKIQFNKETIRNHLPNIICRNQDVSRSPVCIKDKSSSPLAKSRLKSILETNKAETLKSVIKGCSNTQKIPLSPCKALQIQTHQSFKSKLHSELSVKNFSQNNKQNDIIKHYREQRKSMQKNFNAERSRSKIRKSCIFKPSLLSHQISRNDMRC